MERHAYASNHQMLPQPLPKEAGNIPRGDTYMHMPLLAYFTFL